MTQFNPAATDLLARVDAGEFDNTPPSEVLSLLGEWSKSQTGINDPRFYRAVIVQLWIIHQHYKNGEPVFVTDEFPYPFPLTHANVRNALVVGLEMAIAERYGVERAETETRNFYLLMLDAVQGMALTLSPLGVEVLTDICVSILQGAVSDDATEVVH